MTKEAPSLLDAVAWRYRMAEGQPWYYCGHNPKGDVPDGWIVEPMFLAPAVSADNSLADALARVLEHCDYTSDAETEFEKAVIAGRKALDLHIRGLLGLSSVAPTTGETPRSDAAWNLDHGHDPLEQASAMYDLARLLETELRDTKKNTPPIRFELGLAVDILKASARTTLAPVDRDLCVRHITEAFRLTFPGQYAPVRATPRVASSAIKRTENERGDDKQYRELLRSTRQFITGDMKLMCRVGESDRACMNRCKEALLEEIDKVLSAPSHVGTSEAVSGVRALETALQNGIHWSRCPVGTFGEVLSLIRAHVIDAQPSAIKRTENERGDDARIAAAIRALKGGS